MNDKKTLTDVELVCNIINVFYLHKPLTCFTAKQMYDYLNKYFIVEQERVADTLETMVNQAILGNRSAALDNEGNVLQWTYIWSIRQQDDGSHPVHISNGN